MTQAEIRNLENAGRSTAIWSADPYEDNAAFGNIARALLPATFILATATALLVALL